MSSPQDSLRAWLPHLLMLVLMALAVWLLAAVFAPIRDPVLLAVCLVALSFSALFEPIDHALAPLRWLSGEWRKRLSALLATLAMILFLVSPILLMLVTSKFNPREIWTVIVGLATRDQGQIAKLASLAGDKVNDMLTIYPDLPISAQEVEKFLNTTLGSTSQQAMLGFVFKDTGGFLAQMVLSLILVYYFYEHGPRLARVLLGYSPLNATQRGELKRRFRNIVLRLLNDTICEAVLKGLAMGFLAWYIGDFPFFIVAAVATFVGLIPVVGFMFVWLPLATLLWQVRDDHVSALALAVASPAANFLIQQLSNRIGKRLHHQDSWMSVLLFLSLVGGVLAFGAKGLVVGPTAVVITAVLGSFWLPLYGVGKPQADANQTDPPS